MLFGIKDSILFYLIFIKFSCKFFELINKKFYIHKSKTQGKWKNLNLRFEIYGSTDLSKFEKK